MKIPEANTVQDRSSPKGVSHRAKPTCRIRTLMNRHKKGATKTRKNGTDHQGSDGELKTNTFQTEGSRISGKEENESKSKSHKEKRTEIQTVQKSEGDGPGGH